MLKSAAPTATRLGPGHVGMLLTALVALVVAAGGLGNEFVQDDRVMLLQNARMAAPVDWGALISLPYWPPPWTDRLWRPLSSVMLALQYQLGGEAPFLFRLVSALLYVATSVGVLLLAGRLVSGPVALAVALLFAAHPLHVEAIALAVAQGELLVALLALAMTGWYLYRRSTDNGALRPGDWALLAGGYLAASLSKEHGLLLPGLLLAAELLLVATPGMGKARRPWLGFAMLAGIGIVVLLARSLVLQDASAVSFTAEALSGLDIGGRALTMLMVATHWARLFLWPAHLRTDYAPQEFVASSSWGAAELGGLGLVLAVLGAIWLTRRGAPVVSFGLAWMVVALIPVSNVLVPTGVLVAERTLFLASLGVLIALGGAADLALGADSARRRTSRVVVALAVMMLVGIGIWRSVARWPVWKDEAAYVRGTVADSPMSFRAQRAQGELLFLQRRRAEGIAAYGRAIQYAPPGEVWRVRNDLARRYFEENQAALALEQLLASRREHPGEAETWNYLILAYLNLGEYPTAMQEAESALARGLPAQMFGDLRALADTAMKAGAPRGSIRVQVYR